MNLSPEVSFLIFFLGINLGLFLPGFFLDMKNSSLFPVKKFLKEKTLKNKINYLFVRENQDPYKINGDLVSVCAGILLTQNWLEPVWQETLLGVCLALSFVYLIYYFFMVNFYQTVPVLYNDLQFAKVGWEIATQRFPLLFALGIVALGGILALWFFVGKLFAPVLLALEVPGAISLILIILGLYNLYRGFRQRYIIIHQKLLVSPLIHLLRNFKLSVESRAKMKAWVPEYFAKLNHYQETELTKRPNIMLVSIESYGNLIHELPELREYFHQKLKEKETMLKARSWHAVSNSTKAPRISGGSWLSHASFLYGMKINEFALYESLMNNPVFESYQSLLHVLKDKGYHNYYLNPLGGYDMGRINWPQIRRMFAADTLITDEDIKYKGQRTGSMGDSAPDQYAFNFAIEQIEKEAKDPYTLFFITNNSHYSWLSPIKTEANWKDLNSAGYRYEETGKDKLELVEKYKIATSYQLDIFFDFLEKESLDNSILVLFGDHQPPSITTRASTFHSPIHIICQDKSFLKGFEKYGFTKGLIHEDLEHDMSHEAFFSMFMNELLASYGKAGTEIPEFLPQGHQILG